MSVLDLSVIGLQIALPLSLLGLVILVRSASRLELVTKIVGTAVVLLASLFASVWMVLPWWVPYIYLMLLAIALVIVARRHGLTTYWLPPNLRSWIITIAFATLVGWGGFILTDALGGRVPPPEGLVAELEFPLGSGTYLVASGGASGTINGHFLTLNPKTERQAAYRGQSFGADLIKIDALGLRTSGWRPADPSAYAIFGEPVYSPCDGEVLRALDGKRDMPVPQTDQSLLEGNHVILRRGAKAVLLAHLRKGSVRVEEGQFLQVGEQLGEVGNSGQSTEPHLHIHAQELPQSGPILSGEPLHLTLDGHFPVRNARLNGREH